VAKTIAKLKIQTGQKALIAVKSQWLVVAPDPENIVLLRDCSAETRRLRLPVSLVPAI
jgi:hypothetical protein